VTQDQKRWLVPEEAREDERPGRKKSGVRILLTGIPVSG
jgi:hypothetical protein